MNELDDPIISSLSLGDICQLAAMYDNDEDDDNFIRFMTNGSFSIDDEQHQTHFDHLLNVLPDDPNIVFTRDYDSLLGIVKDLPIRTAFTVFPYPDVSRTLKKSVRLSYPMEHLNGKRVPLHRIPNIYLGLFGPRHFVHIFFPNLFDASRSTVALSTEEREAWYSYGLFPAIRDRITPVHIGDWPPTLESELWRARNPNGSYTMQSKMIPSWYASSFGDILRDTLESNEITWAADFFFLVTVQGTKASTTHSPLAENVPNTLQEFMDDANIVLDNIDRSDWYIDVGLEISSPDGDCLEWRTSSHAAVVKTILSITPQNASRITSMFSSKYSRDHTSSLMGLSGCRIEPGKRAQGPLGAVYLQMYSTGKSLTFHRGAHSTAKKMSLHEAMAPKQPPPFVVGLHSALIDAAIHTPSNARVELRVPLTSIDRALLDIDFNALKSSLVVFSREEYWMYKAFRAKNYSKILSRQAQSTSSLRSNPASLALTAMSVREINAIHARGDDGFASRELLRCCLPLTEAETVDEHNLPFRVRVPPSVRRTRRLQEDSDDSFESDDDAQSEEEYFPVPHNPHGITFLRHVLLDGCPRFPVDGPILQDVYINKLFDLTRQEVENLIDADMVPKSLERSSARIVRNRMRMTKAIEQDAEETRESLFDLSSLDLAFEDPDEKGRSLDELITTIYRQFLSDISTKAPNIGGKSNNPYLNLSAQARESIGEGLFKRTNLCGVWVRVQYKVGTRDDWKRVFNHLFPPQDTSVPANIQNYSKCLYYSEWRRFCKRAREDTIKIVREAIYDRIRTLAWIPFAASDKIWVTTPKGQFLRCPPDSTGAAPQVLFHEDHSPTWVEGEDIDVGALGNVGPSSASRPQDDDDDDWN